MKKQGPWEIGWDIFTMLIGIVPIVCFCWYFLGEFHITWPRLDTLNRISIVWIAAGTLAYAVAYCDLIFEYPRSKQHYLGGSWYGPIRMFSVGGLWCLYGLSLLSGPIMLLAVFWGLCSIVRKPGSRK